MPCLSGYEASPPPFLAAPLRPPRPSPPPPPALKMVREWEGVGVWPVATAPPWYRVGRRGLQPLSRGRRLTWEQQMRRWVAWSDPAPAIRRWLAEVSHSLPPRSPRSEGALATVACALYALEGPAPRLLRLEDILMGCFLSLTGTGAHPRWGLPPLNCVPQGLALSGPALPEALGWRYGRAAPLWRSPRLHWREGVRISRVAPLLAPLWDLGPLLARRAGAAAPQPWVDAPQRRALLVEGWDNEAEGSGGHWVSPTTAPSGASCGASGPSPRPGTRAQRR